MSMFLNEEIGDLQILDNLFEYVGPEKQKTMFIEGVMAQAETVNKNKRIYPLNVLAPEVRNYCEEYVNPSRAIGELNHPDHPKPNPERTAILIKKLAMEGTDAVGKAQVIDTVPCGKILRNLIEAGVNMGVSTRGLGAVERDNKRGIDKVTRYRMFAIDSVADPSAPKAFVKGLMEGAEQLFSEGYVGKDVLDEATRAKRLDVDSRIAAFAQLMSRLSSL